MFGKSMQIQCTSGTIYLRRFEKEEIACERVCTMLSDHEVTRYTLMERAPTIEDEAEHWEKTRQDKDNYTWGIYLNDSPLIGVTSIKIDLARYSGSTGFMMFDKAYWRKGIASTSHIARTFYAVKQLDLKTITSGVLSPNTGSRKALMSVGYFITGWVLGERFRDGKYLHHLELQWIQPGYEHLILADGIPEELSSPISEGIERAKRTLERAYKEVKLF